MVNRKTYGKRVSKRRKGTSRYSTYFFIFFILFGIVINTIPMFSFYFGTYTHDTVHSPTASGAELNYYGIYGFEAEPNLTGYGYGFKVSVDGLGNDQYHVAITVYNISGTHVGLNEKNLQKAPFIGSTITKIYSSNVNISYQDDPFLQFILPANTTPVSSYMTMKITGSTREYAAEAYLGYPSYLNTTTTASGSLVNYVSVDGHYTLANFEYTGDFYSFFSTLYPGAKAFTVPVFSTIILGSGNVAISQNWLGWFSYGFDISYPANVALLAVGGVLGIIRFRKGF
ncbi:MAG: hypothetical protein B2I17_06100 [Thermoplasmatales archaeon B_DKE]|nr:MAG: hypothetical protein B2I17_06100 [Thermoplasmatales archaeon B_DKE]QRF75743.1 hypothetical protein Thermo_01249 [Thermoplasmatales archaeon]